MSEDLSTEIKIGADASGVEVGVGKAKRTLASLGQAAEQAGKAGGDGLQKIGAGGEAAARSVDKATKNTIASLQRQIAAFEAGGTSTRRYQEELARMRGLDTNALKPYLDQLDAAKAKADAAARAQSGLGTSIGGLSTIANVAKASISGMLAGLSLGSMFAFVKSINDGVDRLNDLKDATGATIENLSALEDVALRTGTSLDTVGTALVRFNSVLSDDKPGSTQAEALKAIGLSAEELRRLDPAEALRRTAVALSEYADDGNKARLVQELFGKSVKDVAPFLNDLAEKTALVGKLTGEQAAEAEKFNKQLAEISKNSLDLARDLSGPMVKALNDVIAKFKEGREAGNSFLAIGAQNYKDNVSAVYSGYWDRVRSVYGMQPPVAAASVPTSGVPAAPASPVIPKRALEFDPAAAKAAEEERKRAADEARKAAEAARREMGDQAKLMAELGGLSASFSEDWARLTAVYKAGQLTLEQYTKAQADLLAKQPAIKSAADAEAKSLKLITEIAQTAADARNREANAIAAAVEAQERATAQSLATVEDRISALKSEEQAIALASSLNITLAEAVERVALARVQENQARLAPGTEGFEAIEREIAKRKELIELMATRGNREEAAQAAREFERDWKSSVEKYEDIFRKGFADMLNNGKAGWKSFTRSLVTTFKTAVADQIYKMFAQKFVVNIVGNLMGFLGGGGAASAAGAAAGAAGGAGNLLSGAGLLARVGGGIGSLGAGIGAGFSGLMGEAGLMGALDAGGIAIGAGNIMGGLGTIVGALGPIALGIGALYTIWKKLDDSGTYHTGGAAQYSSATGLRSGQSGADYRIGFGRVEEGKETISAVGNIAKGIGSALDAIAVSFGQKAGFEVATAFADDTSKDGAWGALRISKDGKDLLNWEDTRQSRWAPKEFGDGEAGYKQYLAAVAKDTRQVLLDMDLPSWADTMLESLGDTADMDALTGVIQQISMVQTAFTSLGKIIEGFAGMTDKAFESIMKASGGIEALSANAANFYNNYYSADERKANAQQQLDSQFAELGIATPKNRDEFRRLVEQSLADADVQAQARASLVGGVSGAVSAAGKDGFTLDELRGTSLAANIDPALLGNGPVDPATKARMDKFLLGVSELSGKGLNPADFQAGLAGLVDANSEILGLGKDAGKTAAALLGLSGAFAELNESAEEAEARVAREREEAAAAAAAARDKAYQGLERAIAAERQALQAQIDTATQVADTMQGLFDLLHDNVRELYQQVDSTRAQLAGQGNAFIDSSLSAALLTGYLPEQDDLAEAIAAAIGGIDAGGYASQFEKDRARLVLAGQLSQLEEISGKQLTDAQKTLRELEGQSEQLDETLEYWREQIDIANGTYEATVSVERAILGLKTLMFPNSAPPPPAAGAGAGGGGGAGGSGAPPVAVWGGTSPGSAGQAPATRSTKYTVPTSLGTAGKAYVGVSLEEEARLDKFYGGYHAFDGTGDVDGLMAWIKANNLKPWDMAALSGIYEADWARLYRSKGIPGYAVGTNYVPTDGLAYLHQGEAVVPKAYNPAANPGVGGASSQRMEQLIEQLTAEIAELRASAATTASNTAGLPQMVDQFDGVSSGGNSLRSTGAAVLEL